MIQIPRELRVYSFKDFCIRCEEIYKYFWANYEPNFDIAIYRDYLLEKVFFSNCKDIQEALAGRCWEYLMNDINMEELFGSKNILN